ncbi:2-hydroxyacid dehydrogenase [Sphingomonas sp.]|uniref:2-hydroxyacid dehydrogenase n=1 Tax=Sphingomonas sp. TaxID=28214 RepID=UPI003B0023C4
MSARPVVAIAQPHLAGLVPLLAPRYDPIALWQADDATRAGEARAIVVAGEFVVDRAAAEAMPALGLIACFTVGYDGIDLGWARSRGLAVSHAVGTNQEDVADHAIGLVLAERRRIVEGDVAVRGGGWRADAKTVTRSLNGARIGIVGLGAIGEAVARRADAMRMEVAWWGPKPRPEACWPRADSLLALAEASDILVVAARAHDGNRGLVSAEVIAALGPRGLLVNVARGSLVDEDALIAALRDGTLGGAALDVFAREPTPAERWRDVPRCVLTPHTAGATDAAVAEMAAQLLANLDAFFAGGPLPGAVD